MTDKYAKLREVAEKATPGEWHVSGKLTIRLGRNEWIAKALWRNGEANAAYIALANPQTVLALLDDLAAEKARADAAKAEAEKMREKAISNARERNAAEATISTLTAERDALKRERDEAREAHDGWNPISTCPIREPVDLWCVYGGEEFAQYEGGASIGKLVPNRIKTKEYGFFGNQSNDGVPQRDAPDLVPVAWRKAVPSCPATLIAEALGIPVTLEDARSALSDANAAERGA